MFMWSLHALCSLDVTLHCAAQHEGHAVKRKALSWRLMSPYWTVQLPTRSALRYSAYFRRPAARSVSVVFSYRGLQATLHVGYDDDDDDAKRRSFISWNGARLFDDTLAAPSRPELGADRKKQRPRAPRGKESVCGRVASSICTYRTSTAIKFNNEFGCQSERKARRYVFLLKTLTSVDSH